MADASSSFNLHVPIAFFACSIDFAGGSGQAAFDASKTAIYNSAGIDVELLLNGNHLKDLPIGARGTVTLTVTKGVPSKLTAVAVSNGAQLLLNNEKELELSNGSFPHGITISAQNCELKLSF